MMPQTSGCYGNVAITKFWLNLTGKVKLLALLAKRILVGGVGRGRLPAPPQVRACFAGHHQDPQCFRTPETLWDFTNVQSLNSICVSHSGLNSATYSFSYFPLLLHLLYSLIQPQQPELRQQRHICSTLQYFVGYQQTFLPA